MVDEPVARGALVVACMRPAAARLARERGYLAKGSSAGGTRPVLKRVGAVPDDLVDLEPDGVAINGTRLPDNAPSVTDPPGRPLPHALRDRRIVVPGEVRLIGVEIIRSWDSQYFGPVPFDYVHAVRPVLAGGRAAAASPTPAGSTSPRARGSPARARRQESWAGRRDAAVL